MNTTAEELGPMLEEPSEGLIVPVIGNRASSTYGLLDLVILGTCTITYILIIFCIYRVSGGYENVKERLRDYLSATASCARPDGSDSQQPFFLPTRRDTESASTNRSAEPWLSRRWSHCSLNYCLAT